MDGINAATKAALALGAFGSLMGLLNFGLRAIEFWRDRARLRLTTWLDENSVWIKAVNVGRRPTTLEQVGICVKGGDKITIRSSLPTELGEGEAFTGRLAMLAVHTGQRAVVSSPCHVFAEHTGGTRVRQRLPADVYERIKGSALTEGGAGVFFV